MRLLLDQNVPRQLAGYLTDHEVIPARAMGWDDLANGELIAAAEQAGFDVIVTADKNIRYQQNLTARRIGIVVLPSNVWTQIKAHAGLVASVIGQAEAGRYYEIEVERPPLLRRPPPT